MTTYSAPISEFEYKKHGAALITPSDTEGEKNLVDSVNGLRVRFIQTTAAGVVVFRHSDGTESVPVPVAANQSYRLGTLAVHIMATGTTEGLEIIPLWA